MTYTLQGVKHMEKPGADLDDWGDKAKPNYEYFFDGSIRRKPHEFGATGFRFYERAIENLGITSEDIVLDEGSGTGDDGLYIAERFRPKVVFLLEPPSDWNDFDAKFLPLSYRIENEKPPGVSLLSAYSDREPAEAIGISQQARAAGDTRAAFLKPMAGFAEAVDLPDRTVSKLLMIHSAYEFTDLSIGLEEAARVMEDDATGLLIANGPDDKRFLKELLADWSQLLGKPAPQTVSSKLLYPAAAEALAEHFEGVSVVPYQDVMIVDTPEREYIYNWSLDSYRRQFGYKVTQDGSLMRAREEISQKIERAKAASGGVLKDTIDIAAIYFSQPRRT